jgi:hypothetical protein
MKKHLQSVLRCSSAGVFFLEQRFLHVLKILPV